MTLSPIRGSPSGAGAPPARGHTAPVAPRGNELPQARRRAVRGGPPTTQMDIHVEVVTPILGGSSEPRTIDEVDIIRAPSVRGHLRFWWRALFAHTYERAQDLFAAEGALWGAAGANLTQRSAVEVRVEVEEARELTANDIQPSTPGAYALWPARGDRRGTPAAPRRSPGTRFRLLVTAPQEQEQEVVDAVRAWLLFGGYGSRTRRGLGSLAPAAARERWVPAAANREALTKLFGRDVLAPAQRGAGDVPWLAGAALYVGGATGEAMEAWETALDWLKEFRQGTQGAQGHRAREPGTGRPEPTRPSISNWPEADKVRHLRNKKAGHRPQHNATPVWPRAGFGLPIVGRYQSSRRGGGRYDEPDAFELRWKAGGMEHDRLASALIVKALPLSDQQFVPCALWLNRAYPAGGEVFLKNVPNSSAPFDQLTAAGDRVRFNPLQNKSSLRSAFLDWLEATHHTTVVAP